MQKKDRHRFRLVLMTAWLVASGCGGAKPADERWNVILMTVDALRADAVSYAGYAHQTTPELDRLASESTAFLTAIASHFGTPSAMSSLITGRYPSFEGVEVWDSTTNYGFSDLNSPDESTGLTRNVLTLAEILSAAGYRTIGFSTNPYLGAHSGWSQGFEEYEQFLPFLEQARSERSHRLEGTYPPADFVVDRVLSRLADADDEPFFLWFHLMDPHSPYLPPAGFNRLFPHNYTRATDLEINQALYSLLGEQYSGEPPYECAACSYLSVTQQALVAHARALYDGEIRFADQEIGRFLRALKALPISERTVLVVTADHGEAFLDHDRVMHHLSEGGPEELSRIPLLIQTPKDSAPAGAIVEEVVRMVDIAPTILDLVGLRGISLGMDGVSLKPLIEGRPMAPLTAFASSIDFGFARDARWKYRLEREGPGEPRARRELLFDIVADPLEQRDVSAEQGTSLELMRRRYSEFARHLRGRSQAARGPLDKAPEIDPELRERLEALGYLDG